MARQTAIGQALRSIRERMGLRQADTARILHLAPTTVGDIERGRRRLQVDSAREAARAWDDGRLAIALADELTGADSPWLDGPAADLSRAATWAKTCEELREALEAAQAALTHVLRTPGALGPDGRRHVEAALLEIVEAVTAGRITVAVACQAYGISYRGLWRRHREELRTKGYLAGAAGGGRARSAGPAA